MSRVKSSDTKPETFVRRALHAKGFRFRLHRKDLPGKPDIVLPKFKIAVFVHGCFWHQHSDCPRAALPKQNADFWREKMEGNVRRDTETVRRLRESGWEVVTIWQCQLKKATENLLKELQLRQTS